MKALSIFERFQQLRRYIGWTEADEQFVVRFADALRQQFPALIDDFYQEILEHPETAEIVRGGNVQVAFLKQTLRGWLERLVSGPYDAEYAVTRWRVGLKHAEIGLRHMFASAAVSRLRTGMMHCVLEQESEPLEQRHLAVIAINRLIDIDLALIGESYDAHRTSLEKRAERERSEIKFQNLVESAACMIVIVREDGVVLYFSPYAEQLTGFRSHDVVLRKRFASFADDSGTALEELMSALVGEPKQNIEMAVRCQDDGRRWLVWNSMRVEDFDGQAALLAVGHDITEKRRSAERLLQAERLAAIGQTITGLAHESRNALQRIHSCTELLEFEVESNPDAMDLISRSKQAQDDLRRLFDEVRNFAAPIQLEPTPCELPSIWREAWGLLQSERVERDAILEEAVEKGLGRVEVDRFRLVQVFRNLFENSLAACSDPVRLRVLCRRVDHSGGSEIEIVVRDNGPGLDPRAKERVFDPFFTTKSKGTGLGMAIAERILEAHGGSIAIGQGPSPGAEFVLRLPMGSN